MQRPERQRRIGDAAGDDDVGAAAEAVGDRGGAEIDVRRDDRRPVGEKRAAGLARRKLLRRQRAGEVVALDDGDQDAGEAGRAPISQMRIAAPRGFAAPKLLTIRILFSRQVLSTGPTKASSNGL